MLETNRRTRRVAHLAAASLAVLTGCGGESTPPPVVPPPAALTSPPGEFGRNVVRITGISGTDVAGAALLAAFPPRAERPAGWILVRRAAWREQVLAAQFAAAPVHAALLPIERDFLPTAAVDVLSRLKVRGFEASGGLEAMVLGTAARDVFGEVKDAGLKLSQLKADSAAQLAADAVPFAGGFSGHHSSSVLVVSAQDRSYALPAAAWSAYSGDTIAFVDRGSIPPATRSLLRQRQKLTLRRPSIYVIGPRSAVSEDVARALGEYGSVERIAGTTPAETAVALAGFHDPRTGFGWGIRRGPASVSLMSVRHPEDLAAALTFSGSGPRAPLLLTEDAARLPPAAQAFLRGLRGRVRNQAFAFGDEQRFTTRTLARLDALLEPRGPRG